MTKLLQGTLTKSDKIFTRLIQNIVGQVLNPITLSTSMNRSVSWLFSAFIILPFCGRSQFISGSDGFFVKDATPLNIDGLTMIPSQSILVDNNSLSYSGNAVIGNPPKSLNRVYSFGKPIRFSGLLGFFYKDAELNGNSKAELAIAYTNAGNGNFTVTQGSTSLAASNHVFNNFFSTDILKLTALNGDGALPVSLISFEATREKTKVSLDWTTSFEINSSIFQIQRSQNSINWSMIGEIPAARESIQNHQYLVTDDFPVSGLNYYRLKMIDQDGSYAYSQIKNIFFEIEDVEIYPNPTGDQVTLEMNRWSDIESIQISDSRGIQVYSMPKDRIAVGSATSIDMHFLPSGIYFLNIKRKNQYTEATWKIVRQ